MHACPIEYAVSGVHVDNNVLQCRRAVAPGDGNFVHDLPVDAGTQRQGMHACPEGMYMRGLHVGNNLLLCSYDTRLGQVAFGEWVDTGTQGDGMHVCPHEQNHFDYLTGIHAGQNHFLCSRRT